MAKSKELNKKESEVRDEEILALSIKRPSSFEVLVDRYQKAFTRTAFNIIKHREEAEDIVQESFVKIYLNASKYEEMEGASFKSWAYKIVINTSLTHYKKMKRARSMIEYVETSFYESIIDDRSDKIDLEMDMKALLSKVWVKMPEHLQAVLKKYYLEEKSQKDIATEENVSIATIKMRLFRARRSLKQILESDNNLLCATQTYN